MKKEKNLERAHLHSVPDRPLDAISPVEINNQVDMLPARGPICRKNFLRTKKSCEP